MAAPADPQVRRAIIAAAILILALTCAFGVASTPLAAQAEGAARDVRVSLLTPARPVDPDIVIVAVSEKTLDRFAFRSPINRAFLAQLVTKIDAGGPRAIGLDVILDRPTLPEDDAALLKALRSARTRVVIARNDEATEFSKDLGLTDGSVMLLADGADGVMRRTAIDPAGLTFAEALAGQRAPRQETIAFARTASGGVPFVQIPAELVVDMDEPLPLFSGRIVLVGGVLDDADRHLTPLRFAPGTSSMSGVVIHAYQLRQLINGERGPQRSPVWDGAAALAAAVAALLIALSSASILVRLAVALGGALVIGLSVLLAFQAAGLMLNLSLALSAFAASAMLSFGFEEQRRRNQAKEIRNTFGAFVGPEVVRELLADPARVEARADMRDIAIVFTDLADFAALVERCPAREVQLMLNAYLDLLSEIVVAHGGMIDKFVGDGVHAFFGAPIAQDDSAARAARCVLDLEAKTEAFRGEYAKLNVGATRIGAHFGRALVGNFGGVRRLDYTAHGSAVNLTARLEQANKALGTSVCVTAALVEASSDPLLWRPAGQIKVRGLNELVNVHTSLGAVHSREDYLNAYELISTDPKAALVAFEKLERAQPGSDPLITRFRDRLAAGLGGEPVTIM
jgi:class 3 adenylate cyclase/CHASE2 domain-containing sensor protein